MIKAHSKKYILNFKQASGTSRGVLHTKETFFIIIKENDKLGIGECGLFRGLSADDIPEYENKLTWVCKNINLGLVVLIDDLLAFPSIQFGLEQAFLSLQSNDKFNLFPSDFIKKNKSIPINGLVWMGSPSFMKQQVREKLKSGFTTIKLKIGAIDFETELKLLTYIRKEFSPKEIELRVDANGAFSPENALKKLERLADLQIHSIEQPIEAGQWEAMAKLCANTPLPIALDEELIGVFESVKKRELLQKIKPQYIILKPSLVGGMAGSNEWIHLAEKQQIEWWITSALESNIGLNAIAQYTYQLGTKMPQGLGTGGLFTNNFESPLVVKKGHLHYDHALHWNLTNLKLNQ